MQTKVDLNGVYSLSKDVIARKIYGEFMIIPITSGIGGSDDSIYSLNKFGKAIWDKLDGKKNLREIAQLLTRQFEGSKTEIENDCLGFIKELLKKKIV